MKRWYEDWNVVHMNTQHGDKIVIVSLPNAHGKRHVWGYEIYPGDVMADMIDILESSLMELGKDEA